MPDHFVVHTDGGARGNPGPAGIGVVIRLKTENLRLPARPGKTVAEISDYIGETTNNQAEYKAVIAGLDKINDLGGQGSVVECVMDSQLVAEQLRGRYKIKHPELKPLADRVRLLIEELEATVTFRAVPRSENSDADKLVNRAIDAALANRK